MCQDQHGPFPTSPNLADNLFAQVPDVCNAESGKRTGEVRENRKGTEWAGRKDVWERGREVTLETLEQPRGELGRKEDFKEGVP